MAEKGEILGCPKSPQFHSHFKIKIVTGLGIGSGIRFMAGTYSVTPSQEVSLPVDTILGMRLSLAHLLHTVDHSHTPQSYSQSTSA